MRLNFVAALIASLFQLIIGKTYIHIGALIPKLSQQDRFCFASALRVAAAKINNDSSLLTDYEIQLHIKETFGLTGFALQSLYELLYKGPTKVAILGPGYSEPTKAAAEVCTVFGTLQMSYSAIDPTLLSKYSYPFFFRSTPSVQSFNLAKIRFFRYFNWNHVALLYDYTNSLFFQTVDHLSTMMTANNFTTLSISGFSGRFGESVDIQMSKLQAVDARIIVGEFSRSGARKIFCEAYKRKLYGPKYVWIIMQGLPYDWFKDGDDVTCNSSHILKAAEGHFTTTRSNIRTDDQTVVGDADAYSVWNEIKEAKRALRPTRYLHDNSNEFYEGSTFAYDALWVIAKTLDQIVQKPLSYNLTSHRYKSYGISRMMGLTLEKVKLEGVSGPLVYDRNSRERLGEVLYQQFRNGTYHKVGLHKTAEDKIMFKKEKLQKMFPSIFFVFHLCEICIDQEGVPPRDKATIVREAQLYSVVLLLTMWVVALIGLLIAFAFLFMNTKYKEVKIIKMSSPKINNIISVGCILCYMSVILYGIDSRLVDASSLPYFCNSITVLLSVGFTLCFGGLFSKTWRVYKVFTAARSLSKVVIKDYHLFVIIVVLLVVDMAIFIAWFILSPFELQVAEMDIIEDVENDVITIPFVHQCKCRYQAYFTAGVYVYKGLLLIFGLFLAWETRNVTLAVLNDSKFIGMAVYNVGVLSAVGVICITALYNTANYTASYIIVSICVCLSTTVTLLLIFIPKLRMLMSSDANKTPTTFQFKTTTTNRNNTSVREISSNFSSFSVTKKEDTKKVPQNKPQVKPLEIVMERKNQENLQDDEIESEQEFQDKLKSADVDSGISIEEAEARLQGERTAAISQQKRSEGELNSIKLQPFDEDREKEMEEVDECDIILHSSGDATIESHEKMVTFHDEYDDEIFCVEREEEEGGAIEINNSIYEEFNGSSITLETNTDSQENIYISTLEYTDQEISQ